MIEFKNCKNIYLYSTKIDMRFGLHKIQMLVAMNFKEEEIKNSAFVFCNKTNAQIKIYYEDEYGVWLLQNRLDDKKFKYPILNNSRTITKKEFELICKGLEIIESEGYKDTKNKDYF